VKTPVFAWEHEFKRAKPASFDPFFHGETEKVLPRCEEPL
jgi:hypothetical protein